MNNSKRSDGRRLLLVVALIGILSTYGISAQNNQVPETTVSEESLDSTVAGTQSTAEGADTSEAREVTTGASAGETATSPGETLSGGTSDGQTGDTEGETSIAGEGTVETTTSVGESSTDQVRTGGVEAGVESSAGGTEGGTTAAVGEASSAGATGTEIQLTVGETTATLTTSTDGAEDGPLGAVQQEEETTGATTAEESLTTSVKQTSKAADVQYTTNVEDKSTERQTETTASIKVTVPAVTIASTGCGSKQSCVKCDTIETKASSADRPQWTISVSVWEAESKFYAEFVFENQRDSNQRGVLRKNRTRKYNCTNEVNRLATRLRGFKKSNASAPMPSPTPSPSPDRIIQRKRRQADQPTTSAPSDGRIIVNVDIDFDDLKNLLTASINDDDDDEDTSNSNENSSQSSAESGTSSGTASTVAGCGSKQSCGKCQTIKTKASSADRPQWTISGSVWEAEGKFYAEFVVQNQRNHNQREILKKNRTQRKYNCQNEVNRHVTRLRGFKKSNASAPMPSTTPTPRPTVPIERKRRQADQPTTSAPSDEFIEVEVDIDFDELKVLLRGSIEDDDDDEEDTSDSIENSSQSSAESGTTSGTASTTLAVSKIEPTDVVPKSVVEQNPVDRGNDVWVAHRGIFMTVLIIISVCVVVTGFCCLVMKCRERGQNRNSEKQPIAMEEAREAPTSASNPIPDHEMIQDEEAPMQERENPAVTPNGGGQHISKADEDNGWVVPLDELSNAEKEKPEVENTRL